MRAKFNILVIILGLFLGGFAMAADSLDIPLPAEKINLDPQEMQDAWSMHVVLQIHRGLFRFLPDGSVKPDIAESFFESDDKKNLTVKLREAKFSDGTLMTAAHVVRTFQRLFVLQASIAADISAIRGSKGDLKSQSGRKNFGVQFVDDRTVIFHLDHINTLFRSLLATPDCAILEVKEDLSVDVKKGLGPYRITAMTPTSLKLELNDDVRKTFATSPRVLNYRLGVKKISEYTDNLVIDHYEIAAEEVKTLLKKGWFRAVGDATRERFLMMNKKLPFGLRESIFNSIDQSAIVSALGNSNYLPAYGLIPYGLPGAKTAKAWQSGPVTEKSSSLLELAFPDSWADGKVVAGLIASQLSKMEIKVVVKSLTFDEWMRRKSTDTYDLLINARGLDFPDSYAILSYFKSGVSQNYLRVDDQDIDRLLDKAITESSFDKRVAIYGEIEQKVLKKYVVVPLHFGAPNSAIWPPAVKSVPAHPLGFHFLPMELVEMK
jgi:ABC-type transport system substrate-binding protein